MLLNGVFSSFVLVRVQKKHHLINLMTLDSSLIVLLLLGIFHKHISRFCQDSVVYSYVVVNCLNLVIELFCNTCVNRFSLAHLMPLFFFSLPIADIGKPEVICYFQGV